MTNRLTLTALLLGILSLGLFLLGIGKQSSYVFDEYPYVSAARAFLAGAQDANPQHPPLAKILIAGGMKLAGDNPVGWRLAGAICGSLTLVAIFLWTYLLLNNYGLALTAAALTLCNNFLFVMSRVAMLDVFYFAFVMWALIAFTAALLLPLRLTQRRLLVLGSGLLFGLGTACKWNAVVTLAAVIPVCGILFLRHQYNLRAIGLPALILGLVILPVAAYGLAYWPLCRELHRPFTLSQLAAMNVFIWRFHVACPGNPALNVPWYDWLFRHTPERGLSYLMGNFVVAWGGLAALAFCAWKFIKSLALAEGLVVLLYAVNLLQWVIIPQKLTCYYYYYPPVMLLSVAIALALNRMQRDRIAGVRIAVLLVVASAVFFLYCYPRMASLDAPFDCAFGCWS